MNARGYTHRPRNIGPAEGGSMDIPRADYLEAWRLYKERRTHPRERTRYHALVLVYKGYTYEQIADVLLVDAGSVSRWMDTYHQRGLSDLKNNPRWGGENGQRRLAREQVARLGTLLGQEAMPGTEVG